MSHRSVLITTIRETIHAALEPVIPRESFTLVRERTYEAADLMHIIMQLRNERSTGTLRINLSQGGIVNVQFHEKQPIPLDDSE